MASAQAGSSRAADAFTSDATSQANAGVLASSSYPFLSRQSRAPADALTSNSTLSVNFFSGEDASQAPSTSYAHSRTMPQVVPRSPRSATRPFGRSKRRVASTSTSAPLALLENTLKLASLGVSASKPDPKRAAKVTLSNRCRPDARVIFDQSHFTRPTINSDQQATRKTTREVTSDGTDGVGLWTSVDSAAASSLGMANFNGTLAHTFAPSASETVTLSSQSPSSSTGALTTVATPASSLIAEGESVASPPATLPASPAQIRRVAAWIKPRSWADLATHMGPSAIGGTATAFSESMNGNGSQEQAPSSTTSPVRRSRTESGPHRLPEKSGVNGSKSAALSLSDIIGRAETQFAAPLTYPRGMINKGNLCFANAILQALVYCAPFYNLFRLLGENVPHDFHNSTPLMEAVIHFLAEFRVISDDVQRKFVESPALVVDALRDIQAASEPFVPEPLYEAMKLNKRFDTMRRGHQEDAEEFLGFFLDTLHEELQSTIQKSEARQHKAMSAAVAGESGVDETSAAADVDEEREVKRPMSPSEGDGWLEVGQKGKTSFTRTMTTAHSPVTRIFGGKLRSVLRTPGSKDSVTLEPYQPLQLDIQPAHVTTIEEALENLTRPETISGVLSSTKTFVDATKQVFVETLPPVLVVHLKRFFYDDIGGVQKSSKVLGYGATLEIPESVVSPARRGEALRKYKLFGVVYHHGRYASGGHYTVDVLRQDRSEWLHIDDTTWQPVNAPSAKGTATVPTATGSLTPINSTAPSSPKIASGQVMLPASHFHDGGSAYLLFYAREDALAASSGSTSADKASSSLAANGLLPPISVRKLAETAAAGPPPSVPGAAPSPLRKSVKHSSPAQAQRRPRA